MHLSDFDYQFPKDQIAQFPLKRRDTSRLCVLNRAHKDCQHTSFSEIGEYLREGDLLVLNDTKVFPARLLGYKSTGGKAEILLLRKLGSHSWEAIIKGMHIGEVILERGLRAYIFRSNGRVKVMFEGKNVERSLKKIAHIALPPYIKRAAERSDETRYQTVYADREGAIAAPTAGLHFTEELLNTLTKKGVFLRRLTLHVGYGTFKPVRTEDVRNHHMDEECYVIPKNTADEINSAKSEGRRVIAVGTSVTRALEGSLSGRPGGRIISGPGSTSIFIYPGYTFKIVDALVTNFHQPKSTPLMLAAAFTGHDLLNTAYRECMDKRYRLFSYGDAMLII